MPSGKGSTNILLRNKTNQNKKELVQALHQTYIVCFLHLVMTNFVNSICEYSHRHTHTLFAVDSLSKTFNNLILKQILKTSPSGIVKEIYLK